MSAPTATYARLRATDPSRWLAAAAQWRQLAASAGRWAAGLGAEHGRITTAWSGTAATAAADRLERQRRAIVRFRLLCWSADQALSEWAATLTRARAQLGQAGRGVLIDNDGRVTGHGPQAAHAAGRITAALELAATADAATSARLAALAGALADPGPPPSPPGPLPPWSAAPAEVNAWWRSLSPEQRRELIAAEPARIGGLDGVPAADRDLANRLRAGDLIDRWDDQEGPRTYLIRFDPDGGGAGAGRVVVAAGDPDSAANVLTHVPGMGTDLASSAIEMTRAERVATRATELDPTVATSAIMWLDYSAPDSLAEAAGRSRAAEGAPALRRFQEGLRATHADGPVRMTLLGHGYGSLVAGSAARAPGLAADAVVLVGSPGAGVERASDLAVPVYAMTSLTDSVQYAAPAPDAALKDLAVSRMAPALGPALAFGLPETDLWHGHNPADPAFGAQVVPAPPLAGHSGYWDPGRPALDDLASITLGRR